MGILADIKGYLAEKLDIHLTLNNKSKKQTIKSKIKVGQVNVENVNVLNLAAVEPNTQEDLKKLLLDYFNNGDVLFVDDESKKLVEQVKLSEQSSENGDLVKYFENKLKPTDWRIFRTGLYTNHLISLGMPTSEIRKSVIQTYGVRGRNILNLASSGHFHTHIKPLYEELSKSPDFNEGIFYEEFERILREMPFAIFVNSNMSSDKLHEMIMDRLQAAQSYSIEKRKIYIHGWGSNVKTIEQCIDQLDENLKVTINKRREVTEIIDATIQF